MSSPTTMRERRRKLKAKILPIINNNENDRTEFARAWNLRQEGIAEEIVASIEAECSAREAGVREELEQKYKDIFDWLRGSNGEFPDLSQKPHYRFRIGLQERLKALSPQEQEGDKSDNQK